MIKNERQYKITKAQVARFAKARDALNRRPNPNGLHPLIAKAQEDAVSGQLEEMENDLREYESLKSGEFQFDSLKLVAELPHVLIKARIAQGLSQKALAERLGLKEQQIQRYEATDYASASLSRIRDVAGALSAQAVAPAVMVGETGKGLGSALTPAPSASHDITTPCPKVR